MANYRVGYSEVQHVRARVSSRQADIRTQPDREQQLERAGRRVGHLLRVPDRWVLEHSSHADHGNSHGLARNRQLRTHLNDAKLRLAGVHCSAAEAQRAYRFLRSIYCDDVPTLRSGGTRYRAARLR